MFVLPGTALSRLPRRLPALTGESIEIRFGHALTAHRGKLLSGSNKGYAVLGAAFLRERQIFLDEDLLKAPRELARIFVHEVFHFVWLRLGNPLRQAYENVLQQEFEKGARGELGWSAESTKQELSPEERAARTTGWRGYACESFCDTAAWIYGPAGSHPEMTLAPRFRRFRRTWFQQRLSGRPLSI